MPETTSLTEDQAQRVYQKVNQLKSKLPPAEVVSEYNPNQDWKSQSYCGKNRVDPELYDTSNVPGSRSDTASQIIRSLALQSLCPKACPVRGHCALDALIGRVNGTVMGGVALPNVHHGKTQKADNERAERQLCRVIIDRAIDEGLPVVRSRREALNLQGEYK